jgi:hypothetical protein
MLSGANSYKKVLIRVSTDGKEAVLSMPMSPYLARSDYAFNTFLLNDEALDAKDKHYMLLLLKHHPKVASRMVAVAKIKGRSNTDGFYYEQRITLPRTCKHKFATQEGDEMFYGKKFVQYPDGSIFLHFELVADTKDNYIPEERLLDPALMKTVQKTPKATATPMDVDGSGARVLSSDESLASAPNQPTKRARKGGSVVVETASNEDSSEDEWANKEDGDAETLFQAQSSAFAKAARKKAANVMKQADKASSLAAAAAEGRAKAQEEHDGDDDDEFVDAE